MNPTTYSSSAATSRSATPGGSLVAMVVALFFIWGGITSLNDVLIPKLKELFELSYAEVMLTQFAFFMGYLVLSVPAGALIAKLGYMRGIATGLVTMVVGCLLFIPAASAAQYSLVLVALFVLAGGITILQVAANPLIAGLGKPETAHSRLTLAQAFNSLGTTLFPYVGAKIILGSVATTDPATLSGSALTAFRAQEAAIIAHTYIGIAIVLALVAGVFWLRRQAMASAADMPAGLSFDLLRRPRLAFGVVAIFLYVGAEVSIGSILVSFLMQPTTLGLDQQSAGERIALYWGGAMVGRFIGAWLLARVRPGMLLMAAAIGAGSLVLAACLGNGGAAGWALIAVGLFNSIMFPTIFSLGLEGLGERTPQGSGLLCMAIVGGAIVPLLTGALADATSLGTALIIPVACYAIIATYGWSARRPA
jgi:FHS family L-fucose permease-like MFS transporter